MFRKIIILFQRLNLSFRYKIALAFLIILLSFLLNAVISIILLNSINQSQERLKANEIYLGRLQSFKLGYTTEIDQLSDTIYISKLPTSFFRHNFRDSLIVTLVKQVPGKGVQSSDTFEKTFGNLYYGAIVDHESELESYIKRGDFDKAKEAWTTFNPDFEKAAKLINDQQQLLTQERSQLESDVAGAILMSTLIICSVTLLSALLAIGLLLLLEFVLVRPLNLLNDALFQVSLGNLDQSLKLENRDEIGKLANSFANATAALRQVLKGTQIGTQLTSQTEELAVASRQQELGAQQQVTSLREVIAAMKELGSTAGQIDRRAGQVSDYIRQTTGQIDQVAFASNNSQECSIEMAQVVERTQINMLEIGQQVKTFSLSVRKLNEQSEATNRVVDLLSTLSKEIHLLALNASIEAAGAGEFGERFKVVARAVKNLAGQAGSATIEANELLTTVRESGLQALEEIASGESRVEEIIKENLVINSSLDKLKNSTQQMNLAVGELQQLADAVNGQAREIKDATRQQQFASEAIINLVNTAGSIAEQTSVSARQVSGNCLALTGVADQLNVVLHQVKFAS